MGRRLDIITCSLVVAALATGCVWADSTPPINRKNVLFLMADDMRPDLGCYYQGEEQPTPTHPPMHTPHLDALASRSLLFKRAYVQFSLCAPSRQSLLTSRRPDNTGIYGFRQNWRTVGGNFTSLPQYFGEHGYTSIGMGKIFHEKFPAGEDPMSWSEPFFKARTFLHYNERNRQLWEEISDAQLHQRPLPDILIASKAIETLQRLAPAALAGEQPFFLAVGFVKPHMPFQYPESFTRFYDPSDVPLPIPGHAARDMPYKAWVSTDFGGYKNTSYNHLNNNFNHSLPDGIVKDFRAGYYRSLSFSDFQLGQVIQELHNLGLENSTVVSFMGDHGWHLGEQGMWRKMSNFEVSVRIPLMISAPGITDDGLETRALVEAVDVFPTLVELAGLPQLSICEGGREAGACTEGRSLLPLFQDPEIQIKEHAFSQVKRSDDIMGYTVRSDQYRYTRWMKFENNVPVWEKVHGEELYDYSVDRHETQNRVFQSEYASIVTHLSSVLANAILKGP